MIYEDVALDGQILSKTVLKDQPEDIERIKKDKATKSAVQVIQGRRTGQHIGVVFVGDGYAQKDFAQYEKDVAHIFKNLSLQEPFKSYLPYFTFYRVDHISSQSGVNKIPSAGLGMYYGCDGLPRLLCVSTTRVMLEARNAPRSDIVFAIANSSEYGGAGYRKPSISTLAARHPAALELALHEVGHSFALLGDEYEDQGSSENCNSYPNISPLNFDEMKKKKQKWHLWQDLKGISSYAGACYSQKYYRPTLDSKMRTLGNTFGEVNLEQFILQIYKKVRPIQFATPEATIKQSGAIEVQPMQPSSHSLTISWYLDGALQPQLKNRTRVETKEIQITKSTHTLTAIVLDNTPLVRDEVAREKYMKQSLKWKLKLR